MKRRTGCDGRLVDLGSSDYSTVLTTQLTGNGADFDVVSIKDVPGYMALVNKGVLEPLDPYIEKDGVDLSGYMGLTDQVKVDGKMYELPFKSDFGLYITTRMYLTMQG